MNPGPVTCTLYNLGQLSSYLSLFIYQMAQLHLPQRGAVKIPSLGSAPGSVGQVGV